MNGSFSKYIVKSNSLVEARYRLSLQEMHVIYWLLIQIKPDDEDFKSHTLNIADFAKIVGVKSENQYKELRKVTKKLIQRVMEIYNSESHEYIQFAWLSSAHYKIKQGSISLQFSPLLKPYLLQLKSHFTKIDIVDTLSLKSIYAVRIFELLLQYLSIGNRKVSVEDLRFYCGVEEQEYKLFSDLKRYVIEKAKSEINLKTEYEVDYSEIKESRKVIAIEWTIKKKDLIKQEQLQKADYVKKELKSQNSIIDSLLEYGFSKMLAKRLLNLHDEKIIKDAIYAVDLQIQRGKAKNPKAMIQTAIKEKWSSDRYQSKKCL